MEETPKSSISIMDFVFGILDRLFKDNASGKVLASRVITVIILFILAIVWYKADDILQTYKDSTYEKYSEAIQSEHNAKFDNIALEQLQIVHVSSGADFSAVFTFRPKNLNYFVDLIAFEGQLPSTIDPKNMGGYPIDKTTPEYTTHLSGRYFNSENEYVFLPTKKKPPEISYMFSCPYFNLDNIYSGTISMYWYNAKPSLSYERLSSICSQAARTLGRAK